MNMNKTRMIKTEACKTNSESIEIDRDVQMVGLFMVIVVLHGL